MTLLLGIDEGTSAVKAVLYDADLRPVAEARREKRLSYPQSGWVEQDPDEVLDAVVGAVGELLTEAADPVTAPAWATAEARLRAIGASSGFWAGADAPRPIPR